MLAFPNFFFFLHSHPRTQCLAGQNGRRALRSGFGEYALLGDVGGVCVDTNNDTIYFCDYTHHAVRAISPEGYVYTLVRGAGASAEEDAEAEETLPFPLRYGDPVAVNQSTMNSEYMKPLCYFSTTNDKLLFFVF
jgi:hypothetical protein